MSVFHRLLVGGFMILGLIIGGGMTASAVWQEPNGAPPGNNVAAPLNRATQFGSTTAAFPLSGTFQAPNSINFSLTPCPSGQTYLSNGTTWACGAAGGSQNLLQVLNNGADANGFIGSVKIGNSNTKTDLTVTGRGSSAVWGISYGAGGANMGILGAYNFSGILGVAADINSFSGYFFGGRGIMVASSLANLPNDAVAYFQNTVDHANVFIDAAADKEPNIVFAEGGSNLWSIGTDYGTNRLRIRGADFGQEVLSIYPNGDIGVGTENPDAKLDVAGTVKVVGFGPDLLKVQSTGGYGLSINSDGEVSTFGESFNFKKVNDQQLGGRINSDRGLFININQDTPTKTGQFRINNDSGNSLVSVTNNGNVAIGQGFGIGDPIKLGVLGKVLLKDGSEGDGKVLTSDANGVATWKTPTGGSNSVYTAGTNITIANNAIAVVANPTFSGNVTANGEINNTTFSPFYINSNGGLQLRINTQANVGGVFTVNNSANTQLLTVTDRGDVGVGITQPMMGGQVTQSGRYLTVRSTDNYPARLVLFNESNSISQLNYAGEILFLAGSGTPKEVGSIRSTIQGSNEDTADIVFSTMNAGSKSQKMTIAANGNVSIGSVAPVAKLNINNSTNVVDFNPASNLASGVTTHGSYGGGYLLHDGNLYAGMWTTGNGTKLNFSTGGTESGFGSADGQLVLASGNVGIGTVNPGAKLEVAGQIKITGGVPGAGKVLTSDATGLASWQALGSGSLPTGINDQTLRNNNGTWQATSGLTVTATGIVTTADNFNVGTIGSNPKPIVVSGSGFINGNLGVGPAALTPSARVDVDGQIRIRGGAPGTGKVLTSDATGLASWADPINNTGPWTKTNANIYPTTLTDSIGIGTQTPTRKLMLASTVANNSIIGIDNTQTNSYDGIVISRSGAEKWFTGINGGNANADYVIRRNASSNDIVVENATGDVGIGTANPESLLSVRKDAAGSRGGEISIVNGATATVGNEAALNFGVEQTTYSGDASTAQIKVRLMATNGASDMIFSNWDGTAFLERARIAANGNVGIGTNNPISKLDVNGWLLTKGVGARLNLGPASGNNPASSPTWVIDNYSGSGLGNDLRIFRQDNVNTALPTWQNLAVVVKGDTGNVGIGVTNPSTKLHVSRRITIEGDSSGDVTSGLVIKQGTASWRISAIDPGTAMAGSLLFTADGSANAVTISPTNNVGIGAFSSASGISDKLTVNGNATIIGGIRLSTNQTRPNCDGTTRGMTWFTQAAAGVKDTYAVCAKDAANTYAWRTLY